jgi:hypothetical protein
MMICFFHKKQIINFSFSTLRARAYGFTDTFCSLLAYAKLTFVS